MGSFFDKVLEDNLGEFASWEKCESYMLEWAIRTATEKVGRSLDEVDMVLAGDLLNQLMSTHFALRSISCPFIGLYGACSRLVLSTLVAAMVLDGGFGRGLLPQYPAIMIRQSASIAFLLSWEYNGHLWLNGQ